MSTISKGQLDELRLAGEYVPSGQYRDVDTGREIHLDEDGRLPASLDGRVAAYVCIEHTWKHHTARRHQESV